MNRKVAGPLRYSKDSKSMKGNISKEAAQAMQNPVTRREVMHIVQVSGRGTVNIGGKNYEIYRAGSRPTGKAQPR